MQGRQYWRSIERLLESPAIKEMLSDEFPEGASDPPRDLDRRSLFKLLGASMALAGLASCRRPEEKIVPYVNAPEGIIPGIPKQYATTMPWGTTALGVVVESHEGRPTKVEGNEMHPTTQGAASLWMQASILSLYDPDRSRNVLRRLAEEEESEAEQRPQEDSEEEEEPDTDIERPQLIRSNWDEFEAFWEEESARLEQQGGQGLAVLSRHYSSPSMARMMNRFRQRFPDSLWVAYDPAGESNILSALGSPETVIQPHYLFQRADTILALDCDFLLTEGDAVAAARGFSLGRNPEEGSSSQDESSESIGSGSSKMNRLYVIESTVSLTGANADHRLAVQSRNIPAIVERLAALVKNPSSREGELTGEIDERIRTIAHDLRNSDAPLVLAGRRQPTRVHAQILEINQVLGAIGKTVLLNSNPDARFGTVQDLSRLTDAMRRGDIQTLAILGPNPVYTAPADLDFKTAMQRIPAIIHLGSHVDETAIHSHWHLPEAHFLESWGDARAADGTVSIIQPLIAPLFSGRSVLDLLILMAEGPGRQAYDVVRETFGEGAWEKALHDGVVASQSSAGDPTSPEPVEATALPGESVVQPEAAPVVSPEGLEIVFSVDPSVYDGSFANNGWLQELPDPITKITWDNAALLSPSTGEDLEVENGDILRLELEGRHLEAPAWIVPGQAHGTVGLALGYGRTRGGFIAEGVGVDAYSLRTSRWPDVAGGLKVTKTGGRYRPAQTQEHWVMEGRPLVREGSLSQYRQHPGFASEPEEHLKAQPLWEAPEMTGQYQWGMTIDLNKCIGCNACIVACQSENNIPIVGRDQVRNSREMHWLRVDRYFTGPPESPEFVFQPVPCMHCENAPCEQVCPVAATVHDNEGINAMVYNRCIGTRYCSNNCPYKVRRFNFFNYTNSFPEIVKLSMNPDVTVRSRGVMEKCTYCIQRINEAKLKASQQDRAVQDGEIQTACQQSCPAQAIAFGDVSDSQTRVSTEKGSPRNYTLLAELYNQPRTSYLAKIRNPNPEWPESSEA